MKKKALDYFAGNKGIMIGFIVSLTFLILLECSNTLSWINTYSDLFSYLSFKDIFQEIIIFLEGIVFVIALIGIWLNFPNIAKPIFIFCFGALGLINKILATFSFVDLYQYYGTNIRFQIFLHIMSYGLLILNFVSLLLIYRRNQNTGIFIGVLIGLIILIIIYFIDELRTHVLGTIISIIISLIPCVCIAFLWLPNIIYNICPICQFKNKKKVKFCGGCGNKIELPKLAKR